MEYQEPKHTDVLTPEQEKVIDEAEAELDAGKGIPHEVVKERLKKMYPGIIN
jgi:hypothetical protein